MLAWTNPLPVQRKKEPQPARLQRQLAT